MTHDLKRLLPYYRSVTVLRLAVCIVSCIVLRHVGHAATLNMYYLLR
jgi:hypothetical protein